MPFDFYGMYNSIRSLRIFHLYVINRSPVHVLNILVPTVPYCEIYLTLILEEVGVLGPVVGAEEQVQVGVGAQMKVGVQVPSY